jgi:small conductance mechanosensitive channel
MANTLSADAGSAIAETGNKAWFWFLNDISNPFFRVIMQVILVVIITFLLYLASKWISKIVARSIMTTSHISNPEYVSKVSMLLSNVVFYTLMIFSVTIAFMAVGINLTIILGWLTFGIWFAFQEIFANMIAGILVFTTKEFQIGDLIEYHDGHTLHFGRIEEITIRYTVLRTLDLRRVIVPNLHLITKTIKTYDSEDTVRLEFSVDLHYNEDLDKAFEICKTAINALDRTTEKEHTRVTFDQLWSSSIIAKVRFYFDPTKKPRPVALSEASKAVFEALRNQEVYVPYPHTTLTVDANDKNLLKTGLFLMQQEHKIHQPHQEK